MEELLNNIYGYDDVKKELMLIRSWFNNKNLLNDKVLLPKGLLFYGIPGCGKTLILREYANSFNSKIIVIDGNTDDVIEEITSKFSEARKEEFAIILIDEIDLLIDKNSLIERAIQAEMDGINNDGSILVLATTNNIRNINKALLRSGRFDRKIEIASPNMKSRKVIIEKFIKELDGNDEYVNYDQISQLSHCTCADLKAIVNDAYLRCNGEFTTEEIENSYQRIVNGNYVDNSIDFKDYRVAVHEAGHAVVAMLSKNWKFYCAKFNIDGGTTELNACDEELDTIAKREERIRIAMAGYVAETVLLGHKDIGSYSDYEKVFDLCTRFVERVCINGLDGFIGPYKDNSNRYESLNKRYKNEKQVSKLLKKYEKETFKIVKTNKNLIKEFADKMYTNGKVYYRDFIPNKDKEICYEVALYCIDNNKVSTNMIQSHFGFGYDKVNKIMKILSKKGIITKDKKIIPKDKEELLNMLR